MSLNVPLREENKTEQTDANAAMLGTVMSAPEDVGLNLDNNSSPVTYTMTYRDMHTSCKMLATSRTAIRILVLSLKGFQM
jgi:hypothetical protein